MNPRVSRPRHLRLTFSCTFRPDNVNSSPDSSLSNSSDLISDTSSERPENTGLVVEDGSSGQTTNKFESDEVVGSSGAGEVEGEVKSEGLVGNVDVKSRLPIVAFLMGLFARFKTGFQRLLKSDLFKWLLFWKQEKWLELLTAEADANPNDAAKESALLAELNKHRLDSSSRLLYCINFSNPVRIERNRICFSCAGKFAFRSCM